MKTLLFLLLTATAISAQYGNNLVQNGSFTTDISGWQNSGFDALQWQSGAINAVYNIGSGWKLFGIDNDNRFSIVSGKTYKYAFDLTINSGAASISTFWRSTFAGGQIKSWGVFNSGNQSVEWQANINTLISISFDKNAFTNFSVDNIEARQKLDTLYLAATGNDNSLGSKNNSIATIPEGTSRGFYNGGVFAFKSGDSFNGTFTAQNNCTLTVYGGTNPVTISAIDANGYTVTISELINPATDARFPKNPKNIRFPKL